MMHNIKSLIYNQFITNKVGGSMKERLAKKIAEKENKIYGNKTFNV